jgi:hypothetical protein
MSADLIETQTAKLGKLPVYAWGIIGGVVVLGAYYVFHSKKNARTPNVSANPDLSSSTVTGSMGTNNVGLADTSQTDANLYPVVGTPNTTITDGGNALGNQTHETNLSWLNRGINYASTTGNTTLGTTTALQKYLAGQPLNTDEQGVVAKVINHLGTAPEGAPQIVKMAKTVQAAVTPTATVPAATTTPKPKAKVEVPLTGPYTAEQLAAQGIVAGYHYSIPASPTH